LETKIFPLNAGGSSIRSLPIGTVLLWNLCTSVPFEDV
jgi:hypothetical protein